MSLKEQYNFVPQKGKVKVITEVLSIRKGKPDYIKVEKIKKVAKGEVLEYIGYVLDGKTFEGISKWYLNSSGDFY